MLKLKVIKGPDLGKSFELHSGEYTVGRAPDCDIVFSSPGISKKHARLSIHGNKCIATDLGSSNGTFVNGVKIHDRILRPGDRVGFHDIIVELNVETATAHAPQPNPASQAWGQNVAYNQKLNMDAPIPASDGPPTLRNMAEGYVEKVILPGVFKLAEIYPLSSVLAGFVVVFVIMVTLLATIPMAALTHEGVQKEAERRALTIARQLATMSERFVSTGNEGNIRTDLAEAEDGVVSALVVAQDDGHIIAPLSRAESFSNDQFVAEARKHDNAPYYFAELPGSRLGVSVPIHGFSQELGQSVVVAEAIIVYKMDSQNWSSTIGLFARIFIIALLLGSVLYFFMYRLIGQPIIEATKELDKALRGEKDIVETKFDFDIFKKLLENVNSAVGRMGRQAGRQPVFNVDRAAEASNFVRIISDPAVAIDESGRFLQVNAAFEELTGMRLLTLQGQDLSVLQDQALKLNLQDLLEKAKAAAGSIVTNQLEFSGFNYEIDMQVSPHEQGDGRINYAIATLKKRNE